MPKRSGPANLSISDLQPLGCQAGSALTPRLSVRIQRRGCAPLPTTKSCCALDPPLRAAWESRSSGQVTGADGGVLRAWWLTVDVAGRPGRAGQFLAHGGGQHFRVRYLGRVGQHSEPKCPGAGQRGEGDGDIAGGVRDRITPRSGAPAKVSGCAGPRRLAARLWTSRWRLTSRRSSRWGPAARNSGPGSVTDMAGWGLALARDRGDPGDRAGQAISGGGVTGMSGPVPGTSTAPAGIGAGRDGSPGRRRQRREGGARRWHRRSGGSRCRACCCPRASAAGSGPDGRHTRVSAPSRAGACQGCVLPRCA
jgi:hypothetical protein